MILILVKVEINDNQYPYKINEKTSNSFKTISYSIIIINYLFNIENKYFIKKKKI